MGGSYSSSSTYSKPSVSLNTQQSAKSMKSFFAKETSSLAGAYALFFAQDAYSGTAKKKGFIKQLAEIQNCKEIPKEFPEIEYEAKIAVDVISDEKRTDELMTDQSATNQSATNQSATIEQYLDAFEFPCTETVHRFLKDPINVISEGKNHFYGKEDEEMLVVIEKGEKTFLKEKSQPLELSTHIPLQNLVMKRTEKRYSAGVNQILEKIAETARAGGMYKGVIRKEKGDAFILDTNDGRIYSFTITRSHLEKKEGTEKTRVQTQLEIEYAGYIPGFSAFQEGSEKQIISGMVDLTKYVLVLHNNSPLIPSLRMRLSSTQERKYDFVSGREITFDKMIKQKSLEENCKSDVELTWPFIPFLGTSETEEEVRT